MEIEYLEDVVLHQKRLIGKHVAKREEIVEFAKQWDPQPIYVPEPATQLRPPFESVAPPFFAMAICTLLAAKRRPRIATVRILEYERVQMLNPVHPDDHLTVTCEYIEKVGVESSPDSGIVRAVIEVKNQHSEVVIQSTCAILVARRPAQIS